MKPFTNEREKIIYSAAHTTIESKSTTELYLKSSNTQVISVVCECLFNAVNGNVPVSIPNPNKFEETYKILINPKTSLEKKTAVILSKEGFYLIRHLIYFCFKYLRA